MPKFSEHTFWCLNCGNQALPLLRKQGQERGKFHRKKLYCFKCKIDINCIECRNENEIKEFKEEFKKGTFKQEALESLNHCKGVL